VRARSLARRCGRPACLVEPSGYARRGRLPLLALERPKRGVGSRGTVAWRPREGGHKAGQITCTEIGSDQLAGDPGRRARARCVARSIMTGLWRGARRKRQQAGS
jgi:hypothetical protein